MPALPSVKDPVRKNLYLPKQVTKECQDLAMRRYGIHLSELLARLMVHEKRSKKGLCHVRPRELSPI